MAAQQRLAHLSARESEVIRLVITGAANKKIACQLGISPKTVEKHRAGLMRKLGIRTMPDLMRIWLQAHPDELAEWSPQTSTSDEFS